MISTKLWVGVVLAGAAASCASVPDRAKLEEPRETAVVAAATAPAAVAPRRGAATARAAGVVMYVELAPSNGTSYVDAIAPIIRGVVAEHGAEMTWVVLCPNGADGPVTAFHGQALTDQLAHLPSWLNSRMGGVGNDQFEHGLKRALEMVGPDTELIIISANLALADMTDADRTILKGISATRVVDAISFGDPPGNPGDPPGDPPIDFVPLVSGRVVTFRDGAVVPHPVGHKNRPATVPEGAGPK